MDFGGQRAGEILFEHESVSGHSEQSIPPWKGIAREPIYSADGNAQEREIAIPINSQIATRHISLGQRTGMGWGNENSPAYTLQAGHEHAVCCKIYPEIARSLTARYDGSPCVDRGSNVVCLQGNMIDREAKQNGSGIAESETMFTLNATDLHGICCSAFTAGQGAKANGIGYAKEQSPTLRSETAKISHALRAKANLALRTDMDTYVVEKEKNYMIVRRLTPTECERLQGYPDGWTDIGDWVDTKGKRHKSSDSARYKALGNSIALPQWWWLVCKMAKYLPTHATLGSLFDGIGGFPLVWEECHGKGTAIWASEIEEFPIALTKKRFPDFKAN